MHRTTISIAFLLAASASWSCGNGDDSSATTPPPADAATADSASHDGAASGDGALAPDSTTGDDGATGPDSTTGDGAAADSATPDGAADSASTDAADSATPVACNVGDASAIVSDFQNCYAPSVKPTGACSSAPTCAFCAYDPNCAADPNPPRTFYSCTCESGTWACTVTAMDTAACPADAGHD